MWHIRLGHIAPDYIKKLSKAHTNIKNLNNQDYDESIRECQTCMTAKFNRSPFSQTRTRAEIQLQVIHADTMGSISPTSYPSQCRFIVSFIDNKSRFAMSYAIKNKQEVASCLEKFIRSARNLNGNDLKVCYLECDQGTEFTGKETLNVLEKFGAELRTVCPATPQHNGVAERYNQIIQKKVRAFLIDSEMPANMWDVALGAATYVYNLTPHKSVNWEAPIKVFAPNYNVEIIQVKRFGCLTYAKIAKKPETKFENQSLKTIHVGYTRTGYLLWNPADKKIYESRNV